jgi:phosphohistidine phosphatase
MQVIMIRHATAEDRGRTPDEARRLTREGRADARMTGRALRALGVNLDLLLTSPLARALETARAVAKQHRGATVEQEALLAPGGDVPALDRRLRDLLGRRVSCLGLVGHSPMLNEYIAHLLTGGPKMQVALSKSGVACVELADTWPRGPAEFRWLMRRNQLGLVANRDRPTG